MRVYSSRRWDFPSLSFPSSILHRFPPSLFALHPHFTLISTPPPFLPLVFLQLSSAGFFPCFRVATAMPNLLVRQNTTGCFQSQKTPLFNYSNKLQRNLHAKKLDLFTNIWEETSRNKKLWNTKKIVDKKNFNWIKIYLENEIRASWTSSYERNKKAFVGLMLK